MANVYIIYGAAEHLSGDGYDGTTLETAFVTSGPGLKTVIEAAASGDVVHVGAGTYNLGDLTIQTPDGVSVDGAGMAATVIQSSYGGTNPTANNVRVPSGAVVSDFTIQGTYPLDGDGLTRYQFPLGQVGIDSCTGGIARRIKTISDSDGCFWGTSAGTSTATFEDCEFHSKWDCIAIQSPGATVDLTFQRCKLYSLGPSLTKRLGHAAGEDARAVCLWYTNASATLVDCDIEVSGGTARNYGLMVNAATLRVQMIRGSITIANVNEADRSILNVDGTVLLHNVTYNNAITEGVITEDNVGTLYSQSEGALWSTADTWNTAANGSGTDRAPIDGDDLVLQNDNVVVMDCNTPNLKSITNSGTSQLWFDPEDVAELGAPATDLTVHCATITQGGTSSPIAPLASAKKLTIDGGTQSATGRAALGPGAVTVEAGAKAAIECAATGGNTGTTQAVNVAGTVDFTDSVLTGGTAAAGAAYAVLCGLSAVVTFEDCEVVGGTGHATNYGVSAPALISTPLSFTNCSFDNNTAPAINPGKPPTLVIDKPDAATILAGTTILGVAGEATASGGGGFLTLGTKGDSKMGILRKQTRITLGASATLASLLTTAGDPILADIAKLTIKADAAGGYWSLTGAATASSDPIPTSGVEIQTSYTPAILIQVYGTGTITVYQS